MYIYVDLDCGLEIGDRVSIEAFKINSSGSRDESLLAVVMVMKVESIEHSTHHREPAMLEVKLG